MRVTVAQLASIPDKEEVLRLVEEAVCDSRGSELVVFPEGAMHDFRPRFDLASIAERLDGRFVTAVADMARRHTTTIVIGIWESTETERVYNTLVVLDSKGNLVTTYRKIHMFDSFGFTESDRVVPGPIETSIVEISGLRVGLMTCYDLRFPELARALTAAGAEVIVIPAAWVAGPHKVDHWLTLLRARAIENTSHVVAACASEPFYTGHSTIIDPMGLSLVELGELPSLGSADISAERVSEVRALIPSLRHRRMQG